MPIGCLPITLTHSPIYPFNIHQSPITKYYIRSTKDYVRNFTLFLQNEPKFRKSQMNLNNVLTTNYVKWTLGERGKNEAKTKPNEAKLKKAKMSLTLYITRDYEKKPRFKNNENEAKTNPKQTQFQTQPLSAY